jgi:SAM-dependent methyltransferase
MYEKLQLIKRILSIGISKYPYRVQCNICKWNARVFDSDSWHRHTLCQNCGSQVRQRLLFAALATLEQFSVSRIVNNSRVLHFAPEAMLSDYLRANSQSYLTADYSRNDVDLCLDMCCMPSIADGSFDLVVACDVLEHVQDDSQAVEEIFRILSPHGWLILTVPQKDHLPSKYEDPRIRSAEQRELAYGQGDHRRIYGDDFACFIENYGFEVSACPFTPQLSSHPLATNYRKVFFAQKQS